MIVPNICHDAYEYESCVIKKMNDSLRYVFNKY